MKATYLWVAGVWLMATTTSAQKQQLPKEEYLLVPSATSLTMSKGQQDSIKITVIRSKALKAGKSSVVAEAPKDAALDLKIKHMTEKPDEYLLHFVTTADSKPGEYNVVALCTLRQKKKGIALKLIIN